MPKSRVAGLRPLALAGLSLLLLSPLSTSRLAAQTLRLGVELQVNSYTTDAQRLPSVSLDAVGDFVVAWESNAQEGSGYGIFARRFTSAGTAQSVELQVNSRTVSNQQDPSVSLDADGDFVVVWTGSAQDGRTMASSPGGSPPRSRPGR